MRKKLILILSLISIICVSSMMFMSCGLEHHLHPVGTYVSQTTVTDEGTEAEKAWRFMAKFIQEELDEGTKAVSGKVHYAYQVKSKGDSEWTTTKLVLDHVYMTINVGSNAQDYKKAERLQVNCEYGEMLSFNYNDGYFYVFPGFTNIINNVSLLEMSYQNIGKHNTYKFTKTNETFPTEVTPTP